MNQPWALPYSTSQINDFDPGHEGPSCQACAAYQADRHQHGEQSPMLHDLRDRLYKSPHAGTYLFEARYSRWACTQGAHGPLDPYASVRDHPGGLMYTERRPARLAAITPDKETPTMTHYQVTIYHNDESRFMPYENGHRLTAVFCYWVEQPATTEPESLADWAYHIFNADLDHLEQPCTEPNGELAFLAACVYRLLQLRSLSVGDMVEIAAPPHRWWLACEGHGWRRFHAPSNLHGHELTAEKVYRHMHEQRQSR